jgi:malic enzyme
MNQDSRWKAYGKTQKMIVVTDSTVLIGLAKMGKPAPRNLSVFCAAG